MDNIKTCENCRYFIKHYAKYPSDFLLYLDCGHCVNIKKIKRVTDIKTLANNKACELWEPHAIQTEQRKEKILNSIRKMQNKLDEIAMLLKDD
ncbi:MAG: hypothetical protein K2G38_02355 [Clostridia bacterium]|nr:hypothetical protein [Clostridia bacterium]